MKFIGLLLVHISVSINLYAISGNNKFKDFNNATKQLMNKVYNKIPKETVYCQAEFRKDKIIPNVNSHTSNNNIRRKKLEWEHIVPAKDLGELIGWGLGDEKCINNSISKPLGNRECAIKSSPEFKRMYTDLYNIYPAIGFINAKRSDFEFKDGDTRVTQVIAFANNLFSDNKSEFGKCSIDIKEKTVIPPNYAKGIIARTYLYMDSTYRKYRLETKQKNLFNKWNKAYPVTKSECRRAKLIYKLQGNHNKIVKKLCEKANLYK